MGEESGALALGCRPIFSCLITTVGLGPGGAAERAPPPCVAGTDCSALNLLGSSPPPPGA